MEICPHCGAVNQAIKESDERVCLRCGDRESIKKPDYRPAVYIPMIYPAKVKVLAKNMRQEGARIDVIAAKVESECGQRPNQKTVYRWLMGG